MNELQVLTHNEQRVLTTQQLAEVYETDVKNIQMNFGNNKKRFIEGKHYYILKGAELKAFKNLPNDIGLVDKHTPQLILWTEKGADRHCKILDTDKAWEQFDNLEETYFKVKEGNINALPTNPQEILKLIVQANEEVDKKVDALRNDVEDKFDDMPLFNIECHELQKEVKKKGTAVLGGYHSPAYNDRSLRQRVYEDINRQVKREFGVNSYKAIKREYYDSSKTIVEKYDLPVVLKEEILRINNQQYMDI